MFNSICNQFLLFVFDLESQSWYFNASTLIIILQDTEYGIFRLTGLFITHDVQWKHYEGPAGKFSGGFK